MLKRLLFILLIIFAIVVSIVIYDLPSRIIYKFLPTLVRYRYGMITDIKEIDGGFSHGIILSNVKLKTKTANIECKEVFTDIKFLDLLFPHRGHAYNIYLTQPSIFVNYIPHSAPSKFSIRTTFWLNTRIFISNAELTVKGLKQDSPVRFSGELDLNRREHLIRLSNWKVLIANLAVKLSGNINRRKELDLEANFAGSENKFLIKGSIQNPEIYTKWANLETSFKVEDVKFENGQLVCPRIFGNIYLQGIQPIDIEGGLLINKDFIKFDKMTVMRFAKVEGIIYRDKPSRINLRIDNVDGNKMSEKFPDVLKMFIASHCINADFDMYGMIQHLQAGGVLKLSSSPLEIACRYRNHIFSFRSLGEGVFKVYGSIKWGKAQTIKIKGIFNEIDIKDFMELIGKKPNEKWKGIINGQFFISGDVASPLLEAKLDIIDAEFGSMKFDIAYLNLNSSGSGPINVAHSMVYYKEVPAELSGYIDIKEKDILKNIEIRPTSDSFIWQGINVKKNEQGDISFGKDLGGNVNVNFKSVVTSDPENEKGEEKKPEVELEYKIRDDKNILLKMGEDEGTVGVEQKVKF